MTSKADFDLIFVFGQRISILREISWPLEVIEVSENMQSVFEARKGLCQTRGWRIKEAGRRSWLVRDKDLVDLPGLSFGLTNKKKILHMLKVEEMKNDKDDGTRSWKMGTLSWGRRKIPVVKQDVGGYVWFVYVQALKHWEFVAAAAGLNAHAHCVRRRRRLGCALYWRFPCGI